MGGDNFPKEHICRYMDNLKLFQMTALKCLKFTRTVSAVLINRMQMNDYQLNVRTHRQKIKNFKRFYLSNTYLSTYLPPFFNFLKKSFNWVGTRKVFLVLPKKQSAQIVPMIRIR